MFKEDYTLNEYGRYLWFDISDHEKQLEVGYFESGMSEYIINARQDTQLTPEASDVLVQLQHTHADSWNAQVIKDSIPPECIQHVVPSESNQLFTVTAFSDGIIIRIFYSKSQNIWQLEDDLVEGHIMMDDNDTYEPIIYTKHTVSERFTRMVTSMAQLSTRLDKQMVYCCFMPNKYHYGYTSGYVFDDKPTSTVEPISYVNTDRVFIIGQYPNQIDGYKHIQPFTWESIGLNIPSYQLPTWSMTLTQAIQYLHNHVTSTHTRPHIYRLRVEGFGYITHLRTHYIRCIRGYTSTLLKRYLEVYNDKQLLLQLLDIYPEFIPIADVFEDVSTEYTHELSTHIPDTLEDMKTLDMSSRMTQLTLSEHTRDNMITLTEYMKHNDIHHMSRYVLQLYKHHVNSDERLRSLWYTTITERLPHKFRKYYRRNLDPKLYDKDDFNRDGHHK